MSGGRHPEGRMTRPYIKTPARTRSSTSAVSEGKPHKKEWRAMEISSVTCGELMAVKRQQSLK